MTWLKRKEKIEDRRMKKKKKKKNNKKKRRKRKNNENNLAISKIFPTSKKRMKSYKFYAIGGCDDCRGTGYSGRTGIFELMTISEKIKDLILKEPSAIKIREEAVKENMTGLRENGLKKVIEGITTAEEILRVSESEDIGA